MKTINLILLIFIAFGFSRPSEAPGTIQGCVTNESKEALIGVNILIKGTATGTVTNIDGCFSLDVEGFPVTIVVSSTGFETQELELAEATADFTIEMTSSISLLDEVAVTALGSSRSDKRRAEASTSAPAKDRALTSSSVATPRTTPPSPPVVTEYRTVFSPETYEEKIIAVSERAEMSPEDKFMEGIDDADAEMIAVEAQSASQLTAGEVNDFSKWDMWEDISQEDLAIHRSEWKQYADHRYALQLTNEAGFPVVNASVELRDGQGNVLWEAKTDPSGKAELWAHFFEDVRTPANGLEIRGKLGSVSFRIPNAKPFAEGINFHKLAVPCAEKAIIDLAFVVDATGSMQDEISYLQAELMDVVQRVQDTLPDADLQLGSVFYRDQGEEYLTRPSLLNGDPKATLDFIKDQHADGGGDRPEAVEDAMEEALNVMGWRENATTRIIFLVLDAPPHQTEASISRMQILTAKAATKGVQIIPITCSGVDKSTEYLMRCLALATNGTYTFLTDHSGIGNSHIEPSTDAYAVEFLNDLMVRLIVQFSSLTSCEETATLAQHNNTPFKNALTNTEAQWQYYPNPTTGPVTLQFEEEANGELFLADANGKLLQRIADVSADANLDLSNYPAGTYWLVYQDEEGGMSQGRVILGRL